MFVCPRIYVLNSVKTATFYAPTLETTIPAACLKKGTENLCSSAGRCSCRAL